MRSIDYWRQSGFFDPYLFNKKICAIGAGAIGSNLIMTLSKMGVGLNNPIEVWDGDKVEAHNLSNQVYFPSDLGKLKAEALQQRVKEAAEIELNIHPRYYIPNEEDRLSGLVLMVVDTIQVRRDIWEEIKENYDVSYVLDTRIGLSAGQINIVNCFSEEEKAHYERSLVMGDEEIPDGPCNLRMCLDTVSFLVGIAARQVVNIIRNEPTPRFIALSNVECLGMFPGIYSE